MIIYFADRHLNIIGTASSSLPGGFRFYDDKTVEEVDSGANSFECSVAYNDKTRAELESIAEAGMFIIKGSGRGFTDEEDVYDSVYHIVETEFSTADQSLYLYAEDAGLDLLNTICDSVTYTNYTLKQMMEASLPQGWIVENNSNATSTKTNEWTSDSTCVERLQSICTLFDVEMFYSFTIERLSISAKKIVVVNKRGNQEAVHQCRLNKDIDSITTKRSVADLATAYAVTGGTPEGGDVPINLVGYSYSYTDPVTGDVYSVDTTTGQMRNTSAMARWTSALDGDGLIVKTFTFDTTDKAILAGQARAQLQVYSQPVVNYEVDFAYLPADIQVGDRLNIVDEEGELFLEARVLKLETSVTNETNEATLGEFLIKENGISAVVAKALEEALANAGKVFTWEIYASDGIGTDASLNKTNKIYKGTLANRTTALTDIAQAQAVGMSAFNWTLMPSDLVDVEKSTIKIGVSDVDVVTYGDADIAFVDDYLVGGDILNLAIVYRLCRNTDVYVDQNIYLTKLYDTEALKYYWDWAGQYGAITQAEFTEHYYNYYTMPHYGVRCDSSSTYSSSAEYISLTTGTIVSISQTEFEANPTNYAVKRNANLYPRSWCGRMKHGGASVSFGTPDEVYEISGTSLNEVTITQAAYEANPTKYWLFNYAAIPLGAVTIRVVDRISSIGGGVISTSSELELFDGKGKINYTEYAAASTPTVSEGVLLISSAQHIDIDAEGDVGIDYEGKLYMNNREYHHILVSNVAPTSADGEDGDVWLQYI